MSSSLVDSDLRVASSLLEDFDSVPRAHIYGQDTLVLERQTERLGVVSSNDWRASPRTPTSDVLILANLRKELWKLNCRLANEHNDVDFDRNTNRHNVLRSEIADQLSMSIKEKYAQIDPKVRIFNNGSDMSKEGLHQLCCDIRARPKCGRVVFHYVGDECVEGAELLSATSALCNLECGEILYINEIIEWLGYPLLILLDCPYSGGIVDYLKSHYSDVQDRRSYSDLLVFTSCSKHEDNSDQVVSSLFSSCLLNPLQVAIALWTGLDNGQPHAASEKPSGTITDRSSSLGHLHWILTTITDCFAWRHMRREHFQYFYRQDVLLSALSRNLICTQRLSHPKRVQLWPFGVFPTVQAMGGSQAWDQWELALDQVMLTDKPSRFFEHQLVSFESLLCGDTDDLTTQCESLPVLLQCLLSLTYRCKALELIAQFMDISPKCVDLMLTVGVMPYITKLLRKLYVNQNYQQPLLVIWAKVLAFDKTCQRDLIVDNSHRHFVEVIMPSTREPSSSMLRMDTRPKCACCDTLQGDQRSLTDSVMAWNCDHLSLFCLSRIADGCDAAQRKLVECSLVPILCHFLGDRSDPLLLSLTALTLERLDLHGKQAAILNNAVELIFTGLQWTKDNVSCRITLLNCLGTLLGSGNNSVDQRIVAYALKHKADLNAFVRQHVFIILSKFAQAFNPTFHDMSRRNLREESISDEENKWTPIRSALHGSDKSGTPFQSINVFTRVYQTLHDLREDCCASITNVSIDQMTSSELKGSSPFKTLLRHVLLGKSGLWKYRNRLHHTTLNVVKHSLCTVPEHITSIVSNPLAVFSSTYGSCISFHSVLPLLAQINQDGLCVSHVNRPDSALIEMTHNVLKPNGIRWVNEQYDNPSLVVSTKDGILAIFSIIADDAIMLVDGFRTDCKTPVIDWNYRLASLLITSSVSGATVLYDLHRMACVSSWSEQVAAVQCTTPLVDNRFAITYSDNTISLYDIRQRKACQSYHHPSKDKTVILADYGYFANECMTVTSDGNVWIGDRLYQSSLVSSRRPFRSGVVHHPTQSILLAGSGASSGRTSSGDKYSGRLTVYSQRKLCDPPEVKHLMLSEIGLKFANISETSQSTHQVVQQEGRHINPSSAVRLRDFQMHPILPILLTRHTVVRDIKNMTSYSGQSSSPHLSQHSVKHDVISVHVNPSAKCLRLDS